MQKIIAISTCFLQKINISSNKPNKPLQKFRCTLTNLNTADEVTRIDGISKGRSNKAKNYSWLPATSWVLGSILGGYRYPMDFKLSYNDEDNGQALHKLVRFP
jgi:hypothetical protein